MIRRKAAGVGITHDGNILLAKRIKYYEGQKVSFGGYWSIFSGSIEGSEKPRDCAARELWEEAQIKVDAKDLNFVNTIKRKDLDLDVFFIESNDMIFPTLNEEHTEFGWFVIEDLKSFPYKLDKEILYSINYWHSKCK
jgi:8-oxo-dGTP pyrophosphatase MutT (NUDIX family)